MRQTLTIDVQASEETIQEVQSVIAGLSWKTALIAAVLFVACAVIIRLVLGLYDRTTEYSKMDKGVRKFLRSGLKVLLWIIAVCVLLGYIGVPMTSLVAVVSVLGVAVSLAIQGILSNLAGGIMLLSSHPFTVGDWVEAGGASGTVEEVGLVYTKLKTVDNKVVYLPNGDVSTKTIVNYSAEERRQLEHKFQLSYDAPVDKVKECVRRVIGEHPMTFTSPEPMVRVCAYNDSSIEYIVRCWVETQNYWTVYYDLLEQCKEAFDEAGIEMTYPHMNVHMTGE